MGELTGKLIEMNVKMVATEGAQMLIVAGILLAALFLFGAFVGWLESKKRWWLCFVVAAVCAAMAVVGSRMPRIKEVHACADGPITLETLTARYDIVKIDGKELVLRVR